MERYAHLEMDDEDSLDRAVDLPGGGKETPQYPWGLRLCLTDAELDKLGMTGEPEEGDILHFSAFAKVTSFTRISDDQGKHSRLEMTVTHMLKMEDESSEM